MRKVTKNIKIEDARSMYPEHQNEMSFEIEKGNTTYQMVNGLVRNGEFVSYGCLCGAMYQNMKASGLLHSDKEYRGKKYSKMAFVRALQLYCCHALGMNEEETTDYIIDNLSGAFPSLSTVEGVKKVLDLVHKSESSATQPIDFLGEQTTVKFWFDILYTASRPKAIFSRYLALRLLSDMTVEEICQDLECPMSYVEDFIDREMSMPESLEKMQLTAPLIEKDSMSGDFDEEYDEIYDINLVMEGEKGEHIVLGSLSVALIKVLEMDGMLYAQAGLQVEESDKENAVRMAYLHNLASGINGIDNLELVVKQLSGAIPSVADVDDVTECLNSGKQHDIEKYGKSEKMLDTLEEIVSASALADMLNGHGKTSAFAKYLACRLTTDMSTSEICESMGLSSEHGKTLEKMESKAPGYWESSFSELNQTEITNK